MRQINFHLFKNEIDIKKTDDLDEKRKIFDEYFAKLHLKVYHYILKKISVPSDAEDIMMDSFGVCWQKFEQFDPRKATFETWLFVVVCNRIKNYYRDKKIKEEHSSLFFDSDEQEDDILDTVCLSELRDILADALMRLSETQRKIVIYRYFENKNSKEIAGLLGMSPVNVRVNLKRALEKIKEYLPAGILK